MTLKLPLFIYLLIDGRIIFGDEGWVELFLMFYKLIAIAKLCYETKIVARFFFHMKGSLHFYLPKKKFKHDYRIYTDPIFFVNIKVIFFLIIGGGGQYVCVCSKSFQSTSGLFYFRWCFFFHNYIFKMLFFLHLR